MLEGGNIPHDGCDSYHPTSPFNNIALLGYFFAVYYTGFSDPVLSNYTIYILSGEGQDSNLGPPGIISGTHKGKIAQGE